jgi:Leucine-rich repeat (LRR) protein
VSRLPDALGFLPHLQILQLEGNPIRSVRRDIIQCGTVRLLKFLRENFKDEGNVNTGSDNVTTVKEVKFPDRYCRVKPQINLHLMSDLRTVSLEYGLLEIIFSLVWQTSKLEVFVWTSYFNN